MAAPKAKPAPEAGQAATLVRAALDALPECAALRQAEASLEALAGQDQALARRRGDPQLLAGPARELGRILLEIDAAAAAVGRQRDEDHAAVRVLQTWDGNGEPPGWDRHPATGRRRPGGEASGGPVRT